MPANLPPQYYELEREFKREQDPKEKLRLAQELLAMMPKHKGTDKLQAELKAKISKLRQQIEGGQKKHGARTAETHDHIEREGAGQAILIGPPNSGKSSLVASLTHAQPLIADYPYTTREPLAGMMTFETVQIQLIDTPPVSEEQFESYLINLIRQADVALLVLDIMSPGLEAEVAITRKLLEEKRIILSSESGETDDPRYSIKKTLVIAHKCFEDDCEKNMENLRKLCPGLEVIPSTILDDEVLLKLRSAIFKSLKIIRVYTKKIGQEPVLIDPIVLPLEGTVEDAALTIHKDFAQKLLFAKVWRPGRFEGQKVKNTFILEDKDIIEFHI
ncbi:MAG: 50S ribosome-binding GTPase [candidate division Zixibacteria bacterium]|nr:50S ribosome-binding GTPase [candidate division Zixibacteria bacterium]